jgi:hypothetical protein
MPPFWAIRLFFSMVQQNGDADLSRSTASNELDQIVTERNSNGNTDLESLDTGISISLVVLRFILNIFYWKKIGFLILFI